MIKRNGDYKADTVENMRGGDGSVTIEHLLSPAELYDKGRLYALLTLEPGSSIGYHVHEGEMESYYILSGAAEYSDGGAPITLLPGDITLTPSGEGHTVKCAGDVPLKFVAQILFK